MKPFKLVPVFKDYLWGGTRLKTMFNKRTDMPLVAESWELAARPDGDCTIADGPFAGMPLSEYLRRFPESTGSNVRRKEELPVLIKLIDAREPLSVQVHPDDEYAMRTKDGAGKTEMWYVLDREPGAFLYCGFERNMTMEDLMHRIADGTVTEVLHRVPVEPGDVLFIEAGTVHAIGAGVLIAEIQQNSNTTYRVFDYGRLGPDGKPRALHIERALEVAERTRFQAILPGHGEAVLLPGGVLHRLVSCPHFIVDRLEFSGICEYETSEASFVSLLCVDGSGILTSPEGVFGVSKGESVFIPAHTGSFSLDGCGVVLLTTVPRME